MARPFIETAINDLAAKHGGRLTPDQVIAAARDKNSPLHSHFTWNMRKAHRERLIEQARELIAMVKVEVTTTYFSAMAPAYVRDPRSGPKEQGYISIARLRNDADAAREAVVTEFARAASALARAKHVAMALGLSDHIEEVRQQILSLSERASQEGMPAMASA
jgi:hypothetical protein